MMKKTICLILSLFFIVVSLYFLMEHIKRFATGFQQYLSPPEKLINIQEKETWLNIFVHGSFGTVLGILSLPKVVKDDVKRSWYHEIIKDMRKDYKFFTEQPILEKGLVKIIPTFDLSEIGNKKLAAYPITKAFDEIYQTVYPMQTNIYYTFGWTGLVSQKRRRLESIRLYNEICEEYDKYKSMGIRPKIRLIAHSHGGNLCLNLAAINHIIQKLGTLNLDGKKFESDSLADIHDLIKSLPNKEFAKTKGKMKRFDYLPSNKDFKIKELVLLGVPIQPETEAFCEYDFFEKIYNIYSTKDYIQQIDFISTKGYSSQRISPKIAQIKNKITQVRIMIERSIKKEKTEILGTQEKNGIQKDESTETVLNKVISSAQAYFADDLKDPTHKDLWFATWDKEDNYLLSPMPIIAIVPLITKTLGQVEGVNKDFDINLKKSKNAQYLKIQISRYNEFQVIFEELFPLETIEKIKENFNKWKPDESEEKDTNLALIFNNIRMKFNRL